MLLRGGALGRLDPFLTTYLAHAPWPRVMQAMKCRACGDQPRQLAFSYTSSSCQQVTFGTIQVRVASERRCGSSREG